MYLQAASLFDLKKLYLLVALCGKWDLSFPDQGSNLPTLQWKCRVLTTGPRGKSPSCFPLSFCTCPALLLNLSFQTPSWGNDCLSDTIFVLLSKTQLSLWYPVVAIYFPIHPSIHPSTHPTNVYHHASSTSSCSGCCYHLSVQENYFEGLERFCPWGVQGTFLWAASALQTTALCLFWPLPPSTGLWSVLPWLTTILGLSSM